jgi:hypothetical protein
MSALPNVDTYPRFLRINLSAADLSMITSRAFTPLLRKCDKEGLQALAIFLVLAVRSIFVNMPFVQNRFYMRKGA